RFRALTQDTKANAKKLRRGQAIHSLQRGSVACRNAAKGGDNEAAIGFEIHRHARACYEPCGFRMLAKLQLRRQDDQSSRAGKIWRPPGPRGRGSTCVTAVKSR